MFRLAQQRVAWLAVGLVAGMALGGLLPHTPLHAVATDRFDTFAIATGPVDDQGEAVYFLDFLTGDLKAAVIGGMQNKFVATYQYNILRDMGVDPGKNPRYLMVTGMSEIKRTTQNRGMRLGASLVYITEVNSGTMAVYGIPFAREVINAGKVVPNAPFVPIDKLQLRTATVREQ